METADIPMTQESYNVKIRNEDNAHHFLHYQGHCSLGVHSKSPNSQPVLLCVKILNQFCDTVCRKRPEILPSDWILHHDSTPAHKALSVKQFLAQK
jgi:hypothetical protein